MMTLGTNTNNGVKNGGVNPNTSLDGKRFSNKVERGLSLEGIKEALQNNSTINIGAITEIITALDKPGVNVSDYFRVDEAKNIVAYNLDNLQLSDEAKSVLKQVFPEKSNKIDWDALQERLSKQLESNQGKITADELRKLLESTLPLEPLNLPPNLRRESEKSNEIDWNALQKRLSEQLKSGDGKTPFTADELKRLLSKAT